jgi:hypothetical protein
MSVRIRLRLDTPLPARPEEPPSDLNQTLPWVPLRGVRAERGSEAQVRCIRCDGRMERGTVPVQIEKEGYKASWEALPAWICCRCETPYFEENEVLLVQCTLALIKQSARTLSQ